MATKTRSKRDKAKWPARYRMGDGYVYAPPEYKAELEYWKQEATRLQMIIEEMHDKLGAVLKDGTDH